MARFVMASKRSGLFTVDAQKASRASFEIAFAADIEANADVKSHDVPANEAASRVVVFDADPKEIATKAAAMPGDVIIEPEILHYAGPKPDPRTAPVPALLPLRSPVMPDVRGAQPFDTGLGSTLQVTITGSGNPVPHALVVLYLRGPLGRVVERNGATDANGVVGFTFGGTFTPAALFIQPIGLFWPKVVRGPRDGDQIELVALPKNGPLAWWHQALGETMFDDGRGTGVHVGVIDTGAGPHPYLSHVKVVGAFIDGNFTPGNAGSDVDSHGSHVCGTIGARPAPGSGDYAGIAPGAALSCARVFPPDSGANQGDISRAIEELSLNQDVDLINMSLGAATGSEIERDAIAAALERGTLCICAAGNSDGPVEFPGAFDEACAISALGLEGWGAVGSPSASRLPQEPTRFGSNGLYLANFSCFGAEIDACGPGVGIIATTPERFGVVSPYQAMDGTSMASPAACAMLAVLLSNDASYTALPRNAVRAEHARAVLQDFSRSVGLAANFQGNGIPRL